MDSNISKRISTIQTPTGPLSVIRPLAKKLLAEGVITGDLDGALRAGDAATVKAAVMADGVCDFCSAPGVESVIEVPDFKMPGGGESTGGWAACAECGALVEKDDRAGLLRRSVNGLSFPKFSRVAIEDLHKRFWQGMEEAGSVVGTVQSVIQFVENKLPVWAAPTISDRGKRVEAIARVSGLTPAEIEAFVSEREIPPEVAKKLWLWQKRFGKVDPRTLADLLDQPKPPVTPAGIPHWQQALDVKFEVASTLRRFLKAADREEFFPEATALHDAEAVQRVVRQAAARKELKDLGYGQDLKALPGAQTYSFNAETEAAIMEASQSFPHDAPLSGIETPNSGSGWFWFSAPLPVASGPSSDYTHALLWTWTGGQRVYQVTLPDEYVAKLEARPELVKALDLALAHDSRNVANGLKFDSDGVDIIGRALRQIGVTQSQLDDWTEEVTEGVPALMFSAYVRVERGGAESLIGKVLPSTRWFWPLTMTFHDMIVFNARSWDDTYGPGTAFAADSTIVGRDITLKIIADLSLFFVQSCLWFRQTVEAKQPILVREKGHIERHARKRYAKEHRLDAEPTVQVVALRKSARVLSAEAPVERQAGARAYHCKWIVQGHPRKQRCGPGRKDIKVIWIESHIAGPEDKPLRTKTKVFAVVR